MTRSILRFWQLGHHHLWWVLLLAALILLAVQPALAGIATGVGLFLLGMQQLEHGLQTLSGGLLEKALRHSTATTTRSVAFGATATAVLQSSSLVTLITMSFVGAGLITLPAAIAMLFGANLGTTSGAWLIALFGLRIDMATLSMPMLGLGLFLLRQKKRERLAIGQLLSGVGLLFLGIHFIKVGFDAMPGLLTFAGLPSQGLLALLLYVLLGVIATVVMQSSHASMLVTLTALASGQINYDQGLAMAIGANIGTTITAILGALGGQAAARRLAASHVVFNVGTGIIALILLAPLRWLVEGGAGLFGWADDELTLRLALFHTLFNALGLTVTLPLLPHLARWLEKIISEPVQPDISTPNQGLIPEVRARFLSSESRLFADTALTALEREFVHLTERGLGVIEQSLGLARAATLPKEEWMMWFQSPDSLVHPADAQMLYEQQIKPIYSDMVSFAYELDVTRTAQQEWREQHVLSAAQQIARATKHAKHLQKNLRRLARHDNPVIATFYNEARRLLSDVCTVCHTLVNNEEGPNNLHDLPLIALWSRAFTEQRLSEWQAALKQRQLDSHSATSLLNDLGYVNDLVETLQHAMQDYFAEDATPMTV